MLNNVFSAPGPPVRATLKPLRLAPAKQGVAALEFGLLAPVMALLVVGVFDLSKVAILKEQVWHAAQSIGLSASTLALPTSPGGPNNLTWQNADLSLSAIYAEIPWLAAGIATGNYTATGNLPSGSVLAVLSSVDYRPVSGCTSNCAFTPVVQWSKAYVHTGFVSTSAALRPCGATLVQAAPGANTDPLNDPKTIATKDVSGTMAKAGITVPDPFLVADVSLTYTPYFFNFITGKVTLSSTYYATVRTSNPLATTNTYAILLDQNDPEAESGSVCGAVVSG